VPAKRPSDQQHVAMEQEQRIEFEGLQAEAVERLRRGQSEAGKFFAVFRLTALPNFSNGTTWELLRDVQPERRPSEGYSVPEPVYSLARTRWRWDIDFAKFSSPVERLRHLRPLQPTFETQKWRVDSTSAQAWIDALEALSIPVRMARRSVVIGHPTAYELQFGDWLHGGTFNWFEQPPPEWRPFSTGCVKLIEQFEALSQNG
jgi:hypothetical protein